MQLYRNYIKRGAVLLLLLFVFGAGILQVRGAESKSANEELERLENERQETIDAIEGLKDSIDSVQQDIEDLQLEKSNIQSYISSLDKQMNVLLSEIAAFEEKIQEKIQDIERTVEELEIAKAVCEEQYESMKMRIQFIYENPAESLLEMLCCSDNVADFVNRADYVSSIVQYDREMLRKLTETKDTIALKEETLKAELEELEMMQAELEVQKAKVNSSISNKKSELAAKNDALDDAADEQAAYKKQLEEQEKLLSDIEDQIARAANPDAYQGTVTGFIWPCPAYTRISSYFGPRPQPVPGASTDHKGVDLAAPGGSAILASAAGVVTTSRYSESAGEYIVIAHGNGISTVYMHCSKRLVSVGDTVAQGQKIGTVGSTGYSSGNHLHFGVIKNGVYVNPLGYITEP